MAQIDKPNLHFNTKLYTGNGGTNQLQELVFNLIGFGLKIEMLLVIIDL